MAEAATAAGVLHGTASSGGTTPPAGAPAAGAGSGRAPAADRAMPVAPPGPKEAVGRLLGFAGSRKKLAVLGCVLAGVNGVFAVMPLVCVWFVLRDLVAVAPNWSAAEGLAFWGWLAFTFSATGLLVYFAALMMWWMMGRRTKKGGMPFMMLYQDALNRMNKAAVEYVRGIPVVKVFQQTVHSFRAFSEAIMSYRDMACQYSKSCQRPQVVQLVAINGTFAVLVPAGILLAHAAGDFAAFLTDFLFYAVFSAITTTMMTKVMYASEAVMMAQDSVRRIDEILATKPLAEPSAAQAGHPRDGSISFEHVGFAYPGALGDALVDMSLEVPAGSTVALVGPSGGGKTTAASLVPRFWDVDSGSVSVGGVDVRDIPASELMAQVAFVFQNDRLFKTSLLENIRAARPGATRAQVEAAAHAAQCDDIMAKFPDGLDTQVGAKGVYLSGGECQRIALARAILKDAPIVVLDEATAFADPENEALIQRALARLCEGKTVLMIAHRLSTVTGADVICVLDGGRVVERGRHDELVAAGGLYAKMWNDYRTSVTWRIEGSGTHAA